MGNWDWIVQAYRGDKLIVETVHRGEASRDLDVSLLEKRDDIDTINVRRWVQGDPNPISDWERMEQRRKRRR